MINKEFFFDKKIAARRKKNNKMRRKFKMITGRLVGSTKNVK